MTCAFQAAKVHPPVHREGPWAGMCEVRSLVSPMTMDLMVIHGNIQSLTEEKWDTLRGTALHYRTHIMVLEELWVERSFSLRMLGYICQLSKRKGRGNA